MSLFKDKRGDGSMRFTDNVLMAVVFIICMMVMFFFLSILCDIIEDSVEGNVNAAIGYREIKKHPASEKDRGRERKPVRCGLHFGFPKQPEGHPERGEVCGRKPHVVHGALHR